MSDKIRSNVTTAYMLFIFDFADPSQAKIDPGLKVAEVFDSQKKADRVKRDLGKEGFNKMLSVYFSQFNTRSGVDYSSLDQALMKNKKVLVRHLGKDKVAYLTLIVTILKSLEPQRRGLLGMAV